MNADTKAQRRPRCVVCGAAELQPVIRTERFAQETDEGRITVVAENVPVEICPACGETFSGSVAGRIRDEAICRALGLMTPTEVRGLREQLGVTTAELARLTGIAETTLSELEQGHMLLNRTLDRYLRVLTAHPENLRFLAELPRPLAASGDPAAVP
jgi:putative zinc finger/helix-turn-helix YgiT family protein